MFYHQVYAEIQDKKVKNIIVCNNYEMANQLARNNYGEEAIAVDCTYWACQVGDTYENGGFIDENGNLREYKGSEAENISKLELENKALKNQISEDNETMLDMAFDLDTVKDENSELNESILDIDFRVSQLEDKEA